MSRHCTNYELYNHSRKIIGCVSECVATYILNYMYLKKRSRFLRSYWLITSFGGGMPMDSAFYGHSSQPDSNQRLQDQSLR